MKKKGEFDYKMVIVVREDLNLSKGKTAAQVAHAAVSCALEAKAKKRTWFRRWYGEGQRKVVLKARDLEHLLELKTKAQNLGLITSLVVDAGLTEIPPETPTCLGIGPGPEELINGVTGSLPLLR